MMRLPNEKKSYQAERSGLSETAELTQAKACGELASRSRSARKRKESRSRVLAQLRVFRTGHLSSCLRLRCQRNSPYRLRPAYAARTDLKAAAAGKSAPRYHRRWDRTNSKARFGRIPRDARGTPTEREQEDFASQFRHPPVDRMPRREAQPAQWPAAASSRPGWRSVCAQ